VADKYVAAVDLGTTGVRCVIFDSHAVCISSSYQEISLSYPKPGWVEQDPEEMFQATLTVLRGCLETGGIPVTDIASIGITNQRETAIVWDPETKIPIYPAIVWQDRRTSPTCRHLRERGLEESVFSKTGLTIDPYFSASKIAWILDTVPGARRRAEKGQLICGTPDTWLVWRLSNTHVTDASNASRTSLFNLHTMSWDDRLMNIFSVPPSCLPTILPSLSQFSLVDPEFAHRDDLPISAVLGDQQAALFGHYGLTQGSTKMTWGTGGFLLSNTGSKPFESKHRLLTTVFFSSKDKVSYGLEGSVFVAGAAIQWLRDGLGVIADAKQTSDMAKSLRSTEGVYFVPALVGLGAPHWDPSARGTIVGITRGTRKEHIVRAALEAIAFQTYEIVKALEDDLGYQLEALQVDGGAARNDFLCQFQADILGIPVIRAESVEMTSRGAALAAGLSSGFWASSKQVSSLSPASAQFDPHMSKASQQELIYSWKQAVQRSKGWQE